MNVETALGSVSRRSFLLTLAGAAAAAAVPALPRAAHAAGTLEEAIKKAVGDKSVSDGGDVISLDLPQIAENGNTVPLGVTVDSAMSGDDMVKHIHIFADGNPSPDVGSFHFTKHSGAAQATTRLRLAKTQNIVAVAEMADGRILMSKAEVKVTIGGCGG